MKKTLFIVVAFILLGSSFSTVHAAQHGLGTNIASSDGTVFTITTENGQTVRRPYTSAGAFLSYSFNTWNSTVAASSEDTALPLGSFIPPQDGKVFCSDRGSDKGTCYLITNGQKAGFTSANVFHGLGYSFNNVEYGDVSFLNATSTISTSATAHQPGTLVNKAGTVYVVSGNGLLGVPSLDTLKSWGYSLSDIVPANSEDQSLTASGVLSARQPQQLAVLAPAFSIPATLNLGASTSTQVSNIPAATTTPASANNQSGISVTSNAATGPLISTGPSVTQAGALNNYSFSSFDQSATYNGGLIAYSINWGDNTITTSSSTQPQGFVSGSPFYTTHTWTSSGSYIITATAIPATGSVGTSTLQITVNATASSGGSGASSNPATIVLTPSPSQVSVSTEQGQQALQKIYVDSNSTQSVNVQAASDGSSWISLGAGLPTSGSVYSGNQNTFFFWVLLGGASTTPGTYNGKIFVNSSAGNITIPVTLTVTAPVQQPAPTARVGQLIGVSSNNGSTLYLVGNGGLYSIPDLATLGSWGLSVSQSLPANSTEAALPTIGYISMKPANSTCTNPLDQIAGTCQ